MADTVPTLSISLAKVCLIVVKAREFDVKDVLTNEDDGSNAADDGMVEVLEDHPDDPVVEELTSFIAAMNEDEQIDLVTLAWLGRGDGDPADWNELRAEAARAHNKRTAPLRGGIIIAALVPFLTTVGAAFSTASSECVAPSVTCYGINAFAGSMRGLIAHPFGPA